MVWLAIVARVVVFAALYVVIRLSGHRLQIRRNLFGLRACRRRARRSPRVRRHRDVHRVHPLRRRQDDRVILLVRRRRDDLRRLRAEA